MTPETGSRQTVHTTTLICLSSLVLEAFCHCRGLLKFCGIGSVKLSLFNELRLVGQVLSQAVDGQCLQFCHRKAHAFSPFGLSCISLLEMQFVSHKVERFVRNIDAWFSEKIFNIAETHTIPQSIGLLIRHRNAPYPTRSSDTNSSFIH